MSSTRRPSSGSAGPPSGSSCSARGDSHETSPVWPSFGAAPRGRGGVFFRRYGTRGCTNPPGFSTNTPRATRWSISGSVRPLPTGATGIRIRLAVSMISSTLRSRVQPWIASRMRSRFAMRTRPSRYRSSSPTSGRPIRTQKSFHCWPVMAQKPTQPSRAGSIDGISMARASGPSTHCPFRSW